MVLDFMKDPPHGRKFHLQNCFELNYKSCEIMTKWDLFAKPISESPGRSACCK